MKQRIGIGSTSVLSMALAEGEGVCLAHRRQKAHGRCRREGDDDIPPVGYPR